LLCPSSPRNGIPEVSARWRSAAITVALVGSPIFRQDPLVTSQRRVRTVRATYSSKRPVASRSRSYRLVSGNGGNQDSRRTVQSS
jgi:hypothetical protein